VAGILDLQRSAGNAAALDAYAEATDWLEDTPDWEALQTAGLGDESVYLPFFSRSSSK